MQNTKAVFSKETAERGNDLSLKATLLKYPIDISHLNCIAGVHSCEWILSEAYSERAEKLLETSISRLADFGIHDDESAQKYMDDAEAKLAFWEVCKKNFDAETESRLETIKQKFLDVVRDWGGLDNIASFLVIMNAIA